MVTKCHKSGREWNPKSKNLYISCPNCLAKVKINKGDELNIDMEKKTTVKFEYNEERNIRIYGKNTHLAEAFVRAVWGIKEKSLKLFAY